MMMMITQVGLMQPVCYVMMIMMMMMLLFISIFWNHDRTNINCCTIYRRECLPLHSHDLLQTRILISCTSVAIGSSSSYY